MGEQRLGRVVDTGKLGLGQGRVDFLVADVVEQHRLAAFAAFQARDQVMARLRNAFGDRAGADRADRVACVGRRFHAVKVG
ncbi:hypothetical protein RB2654_15430 [Rhodobacterales bacterium HTCC2654]|uniref:Uncharacterized protein n=1 Tax=Maritimibacter alkaliphilus HTCC2654 TaxID=314271 RepID=A3VHD5_9RHOB|nr:hypothetical protein RB2654_15430 [Rhodobacterales bacterium HTCC2654] [Maritimibacter alkaliphilus HTCC2654]